MLRPLEQNIGLLNFVILSVNTYENTHLNSVGNYIAKPHTNYLASVPFKMLFTRVFFFAGFRFRMLHASYSVFRETLTAMHILTLPFFSVEEGRGVSFSVKKGST